VQQPKG
jgi:hypothetical protein